MSSPARVRSTIHSRLLPMRQRLIGAALAGALLAFGASCSSDATPDPATTSGGGGGGAGAGQAGGSSVAGAAAGSVGVGGGAAGTLGMAGATTGGGAGTGGGGAGAAGSGGAAGAAGAGGGGSGACAGKPYKLCEDFESGMSGAFPTGWTKFKGYGAGAADDVTMSTEEFHSGKASVKSSSMATGQTRIQKSIAALGATASKHWGRIFYKVQSPAAQPTNGVLHVTFVGLMHGTGENRVVDIVEDNKGMHQWLYNNPDDKGSLGSSYDWKFDAAWHCAEWSVDVGAKSYKFFTDGSEVKQIGFTGKDDAQMAAYSAITVGAEFYQVPPKPFVMWFDDLAIDDNQIGCQ